MYKPNKKAEGEQQFIKKHVTVKKDDPAGNKDDIFNATNVKTYDRSDKHGYNTGEDEKVYEGKELTAAEMKKREKVVRGMKKNFASFKAKYGERAKGVMYATATKMVNEMKHMPSDIKKSSINDDDHYIVHKETGHIAAQTGSGERGRVNAEFHQKKAGSDHAIMTGMQYKNKFGKMMKEDVDLNEAHDYNARAEKNYEFHSKEAKHYLQGIADSLEKHEEKARARKGMYGGSDGINWGDAGSIEYAHKTLRDIYNYICPKDMTEGVEEVTAEEEVLDEVLEELFATMTAEELEVAQTVIDVGDDKMIEEMISDFFEEVFQGKEWIDDEELEEATASKERAGEQEWVSQLSSKSDGGKVQHHLKRGGQVISSHGTESQALAAYKNLKDQKGVKIVREEVEEFDLSDLSEEQLDELSKATVKSYVTKKLSSAEVSKPKTKEEAHKTFKSLSRAARRTSGRTATSGEM